MLRRLTRADESFEIGSRRQGTLSTHSRCCRRPGVYRSGNRIHQLPAAGKTFGERTAEGITGTRCIHRVDDRCAHMFDAAARNNERALRAESDNDGTGAGERGRSG